MTEKRFPFLEVDAPAERVDELGPLLVELGASGVEVRDETTLMRGPGPGRVSLLASFADAATAAAARDQLAEQEPGLSAELGELVGDEWRDKYKEHFVPFALTPNVTVVPPWVAYHARPAELVLCLDPGRAFGTGLHATTALVAEQLDVCAGALRGQRVLDVGTGSGILALTALLLGAAEARAIDSDADVIEVARTNAAANDLAARLEVDTAELAELAERFPFVVANIRATTLIPMAPALHERLAAGGTLVLSGILASEHDEVLSAYLDLGLRHVATTRRGDGDDAWVAVTLTSDD